MPKANNSPLLPEGKMPKPAPAVTQPVDGGATIYYSASSLTNAQQAQQAQPGFDNKEAALSAIAQKMQRNIRKRAAGYVSPTNPDGAVITGSSEYQTATQGESKMLYGLLPAEPAAEANRAVECSDEPIAKAKRESPKALSTKMLSLSTLMDAEKALKGKYVKPESVFKGSLECNKEAGLSKNDSIVKALGTPMVSLSYPADRSNGLTSQHIRAQAEAVMAEFKRVAKKDQEVAADLEGTSSDKEEAFTLPIKPVSIRTKEPSGAVDSIIQSNKGEVNITAVASENAGKGSTDVPTAWEKSDTTTNSTHESERVGDVAQMGDEDWEMVDV